MVAQRQEDQEFEVCLEYILSLSPDQASLDPVSKTQMGNTIIKPQAREMAP